MKTHSAEHTAERTLQKEEQEEQKQHREGKRLKRGPTSDEQEGPDFSGLPDEILAHIGIFVAKLCKTRDYYHLSLVSKRMKGLLMDSQETLSEVILIRLSASKIPGELLVEGDRIDGGTFPIRTLNDLSYFEFLSLLGSRPLYACYDPPPE
jgi:hypothetical protein